MRKNFFYMIGILLFMSLSNSIFAQWAENKYDRQDALYARYLQTGESITVDGIEDAIWSEADSIVVGYGQTVQLPGSGYDLWAGTSVAGDTANAVAKFLYKAPYLYILYKVVDKSVGGWKWDNASGFDGIIMSFKEYTENHSWVQAWDKRMEHFYTWGYNWAYADSFPDPSVLYGASPLFMGNAKVAGGKDDWRTTGQEERWQAVTGVNGTSMDSLPDVGYISEHRINIDSLNFNIDRMGDVLPFSFSMFDADGFISTTNKRWNRTWWGCPWNENWFYSALFLDPNVTTSSSSGVTPPVDYVIPHLNSGQTITVDGNLSDWQTDNTLHFKVKYDDESLFDNIKGTGDWSSGYMQTPINGNSSLVLDPAEVDFYVTFDDANLYVGAQVSDQIVTIPDNALRRDKVSFFVNSRIYKDGEGIFPIKELTIAVDSVGGARILEDLVGLVDTAGVEFALALGSNTNISDITSPDNGFFVEYKIPFSALGYPPSLGDSVVFLGGSVNDIDIFDDVNSNYYNQAFWFTMQKGQHSPAWCVLAPAGAVGVDENPLAPLSIELLGNYPNPFNPTTKIKYSVNVNSDVTLSVYNILGQTVSVMNNLNVQAGYNEFNFDASGLASGVYLYQLKFKNSSSTEVVDTKVSKMVLIK